MSDLRTSLQREITIAKLMRTDKQIEFHNTHTLVYGIYDDFGIDSFNACRDWDTPDGLFKLSSDLHHLDLRARYNSQRDSKVYQFMLKNEIVETIQKMLTEEKFLESKKLLIDFGIKV